MCIYVSLPAMLIVGPSRGNMKTVDIQQRACDDDNYDTGANYENSCDVGYYGEHCKPCPPGFFGAECGGLCSPGCADENCNHVKGCLMDISTQKVEQVHTRTKTSHRLIASTFGISTQATTMFNAEEPKPKGESNVKYIIVGLGVIIAMFLFVVCLQLYTCKRSKSAKSKPLKRKKCEEKGTTGESADDSQHEVEEASNTIRPAGNKSNMRPNMDPNYEDVDEGIELSHLPVFCSGSKEYKRLHILSNSRSSYSPLASENCVHCQQLNNPTVQSSRRLSAENSSDFYLQPVNV